MRIRAVGVLFLVVTCWLALTPAASAHYLESGWVLSHNSSDACADQIAHLSHSSTYPGGFFRAGAQSSTPFYGIPCQGVTLQYNTTHAHNMQIWRYSTSSGWYICATLPSLNGWAYRYDNWRSYFDKGYTSPPCGASSFSLGTVSWTLQGGEWKGGWYIALGTYSPVWNHTLPE